MQMRKAVFLDRDGVINTHRDDYVKCWDEFTFLPGVFEAFRRLSAMPYAVIVVSNQSVIGRGLVLQKVVDDIHQRMLTAIRAQGGRVDEVTYCPHHPDLKCACRKPNPQMLLQVSARENLDLESSYFIGDSPSDVEAATAAGCTPVLVLTGRGRQNQSLLRQKYPGLKVVPNLLAAVEWIHNKSK